MTKALFLDRDGVINIDHGYVYQAEEFEFQSGIFELCQRAQQAGFIILVVTNQSGIARGYYSQADLAKLNNWMVAEFAKQGVNISQVYHCPHHPKFGENNNCDCRKPKPGMILTAADEHNIDLSESVMIGDKLSDLDAAQAAGIERRILLGSEYTQGQPLTDSSVNQVVTELNAIQF